MLSLPSMMIRQSVSSIPPSAWDSRSYEEISICGFTNGDRAKACDPMLTTVEQRGVAVGEEAVNILIGQVEGSIPRDEVEKRVVRTRLVVRGTTR